MDYLPERRLHDAAWQRAALQRLVRERGPDDGRWLDRLKAVAAAGRIEALAETAEAQPAVVLVAADGTPCFLLGLSRLDGVDRLSA